MTYVKKCTALPALVLSTCIIVSCDPGPSGVSLNTTTTDAVTATTTNSEYQAIDGYIVNANISCDGVRNGKTGAAGRFTCPATTTLITVRGGTDVGYSETMLTGGVPFVGELQGSANSRYVTPLTTIATKMATENGIFDAQKYQQSAALLTASLGIPNLNLKMNPVDNIELTKANAQIHQLVAQFSATEDDYALVTEELAEIFESGLPVDLSGDTSTVVSLLNEKLSTSSPNLAQTPDIGAATAAELENTNSTINETNTTAGIETVVTEAAETISTAFTIDSSVPLVRYDSYNNVPEYFSLTDLQDPILHFGAHKAVFPENWDEEIHFSTGAFNINQTLNHATVNVGLSFISSTDNKQLSVTLSGAKLSMTQGDSQSVRIDVPAGTIVNARGVDELGIITDVSVIAKEGEFASSEDGAFTFAFYNVNNRLRRQGHLPLLDSPGNYEMTAVISGVRFNIRKDDGETSASEYTVSNASESITGHGLRGYVSRTTTSTTDVVPDNSQSEEDSGTLTETTDGSNTNSTSTADNQQLVANASNTRCDAPAAELQSTMLAVINDSRAATRICGLTDHPAVSALSWNDKLAVAANVHSQDMVTFNFFSHDGSGGLNVSDRAIAAGYDWRAVGENIAAGQTSVAEVHQGWLDSPGHCRNIMNTIYSEVGAACIVDDSTDYGSYWVVVFGNQP